MKIEIQHFFYVYAISVLLHNSAQSLGKCMVFSSLDGWLQQFLSLSDDKLDVA